MRRGLIEDGLPHLRALLANAKNLQLVVCNGRQVIGQVTEAGLADLAEVGRISYASRTCRVHVG